ncbi:hypothetical protein JZ751_001926 [Albula glossodonta]|uniref:DIX domain-containing protein n=1 Tax=Albula glossodonta TaxID=121402 RepID=A0A8T2PAF4_9TELE|nr:hypothetical protein JZ751_001926 [Albula glossodonta]
MQPSPNTKVLLSDTQGRICVPFKPALQAAAIGLTDLEVVRQRKDARLGSATVLIGCSGISPDKRNCQYPTEQSSYCTTEGGEWGTREEKSKIKDVENHRRIVVKEEISDDNAKLPCFNGRVVSWLVSADGSHSDGGSACADSQADLPPPLERTGGIGDSRPPSFQGEGGGGGWGKLILLSTAVTVPVTRGGVIPVPLYKSCTSS